MNRGERATATTPSPKKKTIKAKTNRAEFKPVVKVAFASPGAKTPDNKDRILPRRGQKNGFASPASDTLVKAISVEDFVPSDPALGPPFPGVKEPREENTLQEEVEDARIRNDMTEDEVAAFKEIFDMFDSNGGGTIGASDLDQALRSVDISLSKEEVAEIFDNMDIDGSGEIEFDEFLRLVANTERFLQSIMSRGKDAESIPKENVLFDAIAMFMKKSALASVNEIVRYYHNNAQRYSNPHDIIGHYTAGARLIGLTQRQMKRDIKKLTKITSDSKSPYAQPLVTSLDTFFEEQTQSEKLRAKQRNKIRQLESLQQNVAQDREKRGRIRLKFLKSVAQEKPKERRDSIYLQFLSMQKHIGKEINQGKLKSLKYSKRSRLNSAGIYLPQLKTIKELHRKKKVGKGSRANDKFIQDLTFDDMESIRKQVSSITTNFYRGMQRGKLRDADKHWQELGTERIKSDTLRKSLKKAFLAYTDYGHIPVSSLVSSYCQQAPEHKSSCAATPIITSNSKALLLRDEGRNMMTNFIDSWPESTKKKAFRFPTVILISFDGFRWDYLDRLNLKNFKYIMENGVRANSLESSFVTKTFPNHFTLVTGLHEESHGILGSKMYDPLYNETFNSSTTDPKWWNATTPIWIKNELASNATVARKSATIFWVGSNVKYNGKLPYYYKPVYNSSFSSEDRFRLVIKLLKEKEPPNFLACYIDEPDRTAHRYGPESEQVNSTLRSIDNLLGKFLETMRTEGFLKHVNIVVVSDHGMTSIEPQNQIVLDNFIDRSWYNPIEVVIFNVESIAQESKHAKKSKGHHSGQRGTKRSYSHEDVSVKIPGAARRQTPGMLLTSFKVLKTKGKGGKETSNERPDEQGEGRPFLKSGNKVNHQKFEESSSEKKPKSEKPKSDENSQNSKDNFNSGDKMDKQSFGGNTEEKKPENEGSQDKDKQSQSNNKQRFGGNDENKKPENEGSQDNNQKGQSNNKQKFGGNDENKKPENEGSQDNNQKGQSNNKQKFGGNDENKKPENEGSQDNNQKGQSNNKQKFGGNDENKKPENEGSQDNNQKGQSNNKQKFGGNDENKKPENEGSQDNDQKSQNNDKQKFGGNDENKKPENEGSQDNDQKSQNNDKQRFGGNDENKKPENEGSQDKDKQNNYYKNGFNSMLEVNNQRFEQKPYKPVNEELKDNDKQKQDGNNNNNFSSGSRIYTQRFGANSETKKPENGGSKDNDKQNNDDGNTNGFSSGLKVDSQRFGGNNENKKLGNGGSQGNDKQNKDNNQQRFGGKTEEKKPENEGSQDNNKKGQSNDKQRFGGNDENKKPDNEGSQDKDKQSQSNNKQRFGGNDENKKPDNEGSQDKDKQSQSNNKQRFVGNDENKKPDNEGSQDKDKQSQSNNKQRFGGNDENKKPDNEGSQDKDKQSQSNNKQRFGGNDENKKPDNEGSQDKDKQSQSNNKQRFGGNDENKKPENEGSQYNDKKGQSNDKQRFGGNDENKKLENEGSQDNGQKSQNNDKQRFGGNDENKKPENEGSQEKDKQSQSNNKQRFGGNDENKKPENEGSKDNDKQNKNDSNNNGLYSGRKVNQKFGDNNGNKKPENEKSQGNDKQFKNENTQNFGGDSDTKKPESEGPKDNDQQNKGNDNESNSKSGNNVNNQKSGSSFQPSANYHQVQQANYWAKNSGVSGDIGDKNWKVSKRHQGQAIKRDKTGHKKHKYSFLKRNNH
eukprot:gene17338-19069_t